ncbi:hypothetical protein YC2023_090091 [Brassica napus]
MEKEQFSSAFHERIDRHGKNFGARALEVGSKNHNYTSPPYSKRSDLIVGRGTQRRTPFPQKGLSEWRLKQGSQPLLPTETTEPTPVAPLIPEGTNRPDQCFQVAPSSQTEVQILKDLNEATLLYLNCPDPTEAAARRQRVLASDSRGQTEAAITRMLKFQGRTSSEIAETSHQYNQNSSSLTKEKFLQELQEVTKQYISCADPVEAAARRLRVLAGDAEELMDKTADSILAASTEQRRPLSPWEMGIRSVSPPAIDFDRAMQPSDVEFTPPPRPRSSEIHHQETTQHEEPNNILMEDVNPARIKSLIISPRDEEAIAQDELRNVMEVAEDEETLQSFQNKAKLKEINLKKKRPRRQVRSSPNILRGASSKKRKISQIQNSPARGARSLDGNKTKTSKKTKEKKNGEAGPSHTTRNPPIQLIPAEAEVCCSSGKKISRSQ